MFDTEKFLKTYASQSVTYSLYKVDKVIKLRDEFIVKLEDQFGIFDLSPEVLISANWLS